MDKKTEFLNFFDAETLFYENKTSLPKKHWVSLTFDDRVVHYAWTINPKTETVWYNGDTIIKERFVVGELTSGYKEAYCTRCKISENVTTIGFDAFGDCRSLTRVDIPISVTNISNSAFGNCSSLADIYFNGTIEQWNSISKANGWREGIYENCVVHCIDGDTNVIDADAFTKWYNGNELVKSLEIVGNLDINVLYNYNWYEWEYNSTEFTKCEIGNTVTEIGSQNNSYSCGCNYGYMAAFANRDDIRSIKIPTSVTSFGEYAFYNSRNLTDIYYDGTKDQWDSIQKGYGWSYQTGLNGYCSLHCTDGLYGGYGFSDL